MIFSPVSRFSVAARSYLTTIVILMLILVAAHFSMQAWGQQQARQWVSAWEKQYDGHVRDVRLRMLRGALTMRDIQWESEGIQFSAPFMLLRGNLASSNTQVDIREAALQGAEVTVSNNLFQKIMQKKISFSALFPQASLLKTVRDVHGTGVKMIVQAGGKGTLLLQPLVIDHINFSSEPQRSQWQLSGNIWDGHIGVSNQNHGQVLTWSNLDAMHLTESLGLAVIQGRMNGKGQWQKNQLSGDVIWQNKSSASNKNNIIEGRLAFQGTIGKSGWGGKVQTESWPLQMFSAYAPVLYHRELKSAYLTGLVQVKNKQQGWQASMMEGSVRQLDYRSQSKDVWHLQNIDFKQAKLTWPQRTLHIHDMAIEQGSWAVDSHAEEPAVLLKTWKVDFSTVSFKSIKLGDIAKNIWLPDVQGKLSLHGQKLNMKASSDSKAMGEWELQAQGLIGKLAVKTQAEHVPLLNFRDALPQTLVKDARLNGDVSLNLSGMWHEAGWQLQGDMDGQDIMWNKGAWLWSAEHMQLKNIVFSSAQMPHVDVWQVDNWSGQTSLTPWFQASNVDTVQQQTAPFSLDGWQIKQLNIGYGKFSLGQEDAVWFESDMIKLDGIEENQVTHMQIQGKLASGRFVFKGDWFPWGEIPWISLHASLKQALPFAAAPWLQLSGLPILTRGRISADIKVNQIKAQPYDYKGKMVFTLKYGQLQNGISSNKMLSEATGYEAHGLFDRINSNGDIHLSVPLQGNWGHTPLNGRVLGQGLLSALAEKAASGVKPLPKKATLHLSNIRLHDSFGGRVDSLKHNERVRLRKVLHVLQRKRKWAIELRPQLGKEPLNEQLIKRVRKTQQQIEAFLVARGIKASRVFQVWPEEGNRQGESTGIVIQAVK